MPQPTRLLFVLSFGALATAACGNDGPHLFDGGMSDAEQHDAKVADTTPPETTIDSAPAALTSAPAAHFTFHADEPSTFQCTLDGGAAQPCDATFDATVAEGAHTFSVVATDTDGNVDPTPATATWTVDVTPPDTTITKKPPAIDNSVDVELDFTTDTGTTFECRVDGAAFAACASPDLIKGLAAGAHTFDVRAVDAAGNVDPTPATWAWTIDTTTPDTTIDSGPTGFVQATTATFTFSSPNAGAGATFACALDAATPTTCTSPITFNGLAEAAHKLTVRVTNAAGTPDPTPAERAWTVDHTAPTVTITGGPTGPTSVAAPSFPFTTTGAPTKTECKTDAGAFAPCATSYTTASLADGAHTITVRVTDAAGNTSSASRAFTVDTVAPAVMITSGPAALTAQTGATFQFTATEAPVAFACALDGGGFTACTPGKAYAGLGDGAHTFQVRATDPAGNTGPAAPYAWTIDTVGPTVTIDPPTPADPSNATSATFVFHSPSDAGATYECAMDGAAFAPCSAGVAFPGLGGGAGTSHTFHVRAKDAAGNVGAAATFTWTIDTQAPTVAFTGGPIDPTPVNDPTPQFTFTTAGSPTKTECQIDGGGFAPCASPFTTGTLADGGHTIVARVTDAAGNTGTASRAFTVDTAGPTVVFTGGPIDPTPTSDKTPQFTFTTAGSPTKTECQVDGGGFAACASPFTTGTLVDGGHTIVARVTDAAGNTGTASRAFTIDTVAPTVTITGGPKDPTPTKDPTPQFTFTTGGSPSKIECQVDGGGFAACTSPFTTAPLIDGGHSVVVRVTDLAGNSATDTRAFTVDTVGPTVVIDAPLPKDPTNVATATFSFHSPDGGTTYECSMDSTTAFTACTSNSASSTFTVSGNPAASHTFRVRASDAAQNQGAAAAFTWQVDTVPVTTTLGSNPPNPTPLTSATFTFVSNKTGAKFACVLDGASSACNSGTVTYPSLSTATHTFTVAATDPAGNVDGSPATYTWVVNPNAPTITNTVPAGWSVSYFPFTFTGPIANPPSYVCSNDGVTYAACGNPAATGAYGDSNKFFVAWADAAGNRSASASRTWAATPGLVLYYPLNNDAKNYSVLEYPTGFESHDADVNPTFLGGIAGGAGNFTSTANLEDTRTPLTSGTSYTLSMWVLAATQGTPSVIWSNVGAGAGCRLEQAYDANGPRVDLRCFDDGGKQFGLVSQYTAAEWVNIIVTYAGTGHGTGKGGDLTMYVYGNSPVVLSNPGKVDVFSSTQLVSSVFGASKNTPVIDDVRFYNTVYDPKTQCLQVLDGDWSVQDWCTPPLPGDQLSLDSSTANTGVWGDVPNLTVGSGAFQAGKYGAAFHFAGAAAMSMTRSSAFPTAPGHTISFWFDDVSGAGTNNLLFRLLSDTGVIVTATSGGLRVVGQALTSAGLSKFDKTVPYALGTWHQVMLVDSQTVVIDPNGGQHQVVPELDVYLDGAQVMAFPFAGGGNLWGGTGGGMTIGSNGVVGTTSPDVLVDEFKIWPMNLVALTNSAGQHEAQCVMARGGLFDSASGTCKGP